MQASLLQLCLTVCDPMDGSPPGPFAHGILQEYWSGSPFSSPGDLPHPGIKPRSLTLQADSLLSEPPGMPLNLVWEIREDPLKKQHGGQDVGAEQWPVTREV